MDGSIGAAARPTVTDAAFARLAEIIAEDGGTSGTRLRVSVLGGGCSGFQYRFELTQTVEPSDAVFAKNGVEVVIDDVSMPFLAGAVIDYKTEIIGARFAIENPNATASCGCGTSFSI